MKKAAIAFTTLICIAFALTAYAAGGTTYTFSGVNIITDGSPNDITDVLLTKDITVTTSGDMNRKYAGITDLKHNNEAGTFPANDSFKATGSYIYLGCANANDNAIITLNMPEIKKGSKVTLTFAKPVVTNNGSTLRNTNDPYAYFKIADRYISINGDNFDTWRTESVVTGESTNAIEFYADKWGAVCISKIEITENDSTPLYSVNISSTQYANLTVNGIKFCADENGKITLPSHPKGEEINITAYKDGYETKEMSQTMPDKDIDISIPLDCTVDAVYYESDFGNASGTLTLDGEYTFPGGVYTEDVTRVFGRVAFDENGYLDINIPFSTAVKLTYRDGIYANNEKVTSKDNMEFEVFFDKKNDIVFVKQNDEYTVLPEASPDFTAITSLSGKDVTVEYIGISYPDTTKITIEGPDIVVAPLNNDDYGNISYRYEARSEYYMPMTEVAFSVESDCATMKTSDISRCELIPKADTEGTITITAEYNGATATKEVKVIKNPKIAEYSRKTQYLPLHYNYDFHKMFGLTDVNDENGNMLYYSKNYILSDFKSSDENILKVSENGYLIPISKGKATITANAYTGIDNPVTLDYVVDDLNYIGWGEAETTYVINEFDNKYITGYTLSWQDGEKKINPSEIPAYIVKENGTVVTASYDFDNKLRSLYSKKVEAGDKILSTNGTRKVYFCKNNSIELVEDNDTTIEGFEFSDVQQGCIYEIIPDYTYTDLGDCAEGVTLDGVFPNGYYDFTFKKGEAKRGDIFVNGFMAGNNVDQADADRKLTEGSEYTVKDFYISGDNKITISMTDGSTLLDSVTVSQSRYYKPTIYIIGDSLVCNYYGDFEQEVGGGRTGWGQVLGNYINANIVNLANSGQYAKGLYDTAFPSVVNNKPDIALIECGYNDRSYSTRDEMIDTVKAMVRECRKKGIEPILVTPNASAHDYKPSVSWSNYLRDVAIDTGCKIIDLSKLSYDFLYSLYSDDEDGNITKTYNLTAVGGDTLHSSYAAAQKWASIVAQEMKNMGIRYGTDRIYNTDYEYTFTDTAGNTITASVK